MRYLLIIITSLTIVSCCKKSNPNDIATNQYTKSDFPIKVGNWWRYKQGDFLANTTDTFILKVVSMRNLNYFCNVEQNNKIIDSALITLNDNEITYRGLNTNYSYFGDFQIFFPLSVGDKKEISLIGVGLGDSMSVISLTQNVKFLGNPYDIYFLKRKVAGPGYSLLQTLSISKGIGIVENSINYFNGAPVMNQTLQLIDYKIK
jgi:hypothetical protein